MNLDHQQRMNCPDWPRLVALREGCRDGRSDDPPGWRSALNHLDSCRHCRPQALAADPTLLFRRLPGAAQVAVDIEAMKRAVATLRRTGPLHNAGGVEGSRSLQRRLSAVAAGLLFVALLGLAPGVGGRRAAVDEQRAAVDEQRAAQQSEVPAEEAAALSVGSLYQAAGFGEELQPFALSESAIEDVDLPNSRVYQISGKEMTIVTVVNASLDV